MKPLWPGFLRWVKISFRKRKLIFSVLRNTKKKNCNRIMDRNGFKVWWGIVLVVLGGGCEKLNEPVPVTMDVELKQEKKGTPDLKKGRLKLKNFTLKGERKEGEDVRVAVEDPLTLDLGEGKVTPPVSFEIPEGQYTRMRILYETEELPGESSTVQLFGTYTRPVPGPGGPGVRRKPFQFSMDSSYTGSIEVFSSRKGRNIAGGGEKDLMMRMDMDVWFSEVDSTLWKNAAEQHIDGKPTVVIDRGNNIPIFSRIMKKFPQGIKGNM